MAVEDATLESSLIDTGDDVGEGDVFGEVGVEVEVDGELCPCEGILGEAEVGPVAEVGEAGLDGLGDTGNALAILCASEGASVTKYRASTYSESW